MTAAESRAHEEPKVESLRLLKNIEPVIQEKKELEEKLALELEALLKT